MKINFNKLSSYHFNIINDLAYVNDLSKLDKLKLREKNL